jgi:thiamine biosynthesis protein ThiS
MKPMRICVNGRSFDLQDNKTLREFIADHIKDTRLIVAELNGNIIKEPQQSEASLREGDSLELITLYGGG